MNSRVQTLFFFFFFFCSEVCKVRHTCFDVLPAVCGESCCLDLQSGLEDPPYTACEITAHLIRQDPPINGRSHCSSQPFKSRRSRTFSSAPRLRRGKPRFCSRVVPLWHISQKHHWKYDGVCVRAFVSTFRFYRRMSSTLLCALIFLACALTFSGAQSEYNLASCNMETLNWFPFFNILWFHLFLMKAFPGMLQVFSACTHSYLLC